jgi:hypothetical protein
MNARVLPDTAALARAAAELVLEPRPLPASDLPSA